MSSEKIDVDYRKLKQLSPEVFKKINELYEVETRFAILMAISNFGSANIKQISNLLGKNEATIHYHIKWLVEEPNLLVIDQAKTMKSKGKYYDLSDIAKKYYYTSADDQELDKLHSGIGKILEQSDERIKEIFIELLSNHPQIDEIILHEERNLAYNHILENIMMQNLNQAIEAIKLGKKPINSRYPLGAISNFPFDMKISKPRHMFQVLQLLAEFNSKFNKLGKDIRQDIEEEQIPENEIINLHFHIVGGEIAEFDFI